MNSSVFREDLYKIINNEIVDNLARKTVLITGATGLLGKILTKALLLANKEKNLNVKIIAQVRNLKKAQGIYPNEAEDTNFKLVVQDITQPLKIEENIDYIFHFASPTSSLAFVNKPTETFNSIVLGTKNILEAAKEKNAKVLFTSTLEVYSSIKTFFPIREEYLGKFDTKNPRNSYPFAKLSAEMLSRSYFYQYGVDTKVARLTQVLGAGIEENDERFCAKIAKCALKKEDIVLHTKGRTKRNYIYTTDAILALLYILFKGEASGVYNVANSKELLSIGQIAKLAAKKYDLRVILKQDKVERGFASELCMPLDTTKLKKLGFEAKINFEQMLDRTVKYLYEIN